MTVVVMLFLIGLILIGFEVIVPGGVLGVLGALVLAGGCVVAFQQFGGSGGGLATLVALVLAGAVLALEFAVLPRTKLGRKMFLQARVSGASQPMPGPADLVGQEAVAATTLSPSGYVMVAGKRFEAFCRSGHAESGTPLKVVGLDNFRLIVTTV